MASAVWASRRRRFLAHAGRFCRGCGRAEELHVHHRSYDNLGAEADGDLVVLCTVCHEGVHALVGAMTLAEATDAVTASQRMQHQRPERAEFVPMNRRPDYNPTWVSGRQGRLRGLPIITKERQSTT